MVKYIWKYYLYESNFKFKRYFYKQKKTISEIAEKNETFYIHLLCNYCSQLESVYSTRQKKDGRGKEIRSACLYILHFVCEIPCSMEFQKYILHVKLI